MNLSFLKTIKPIELEVKKKAIISGLKVWEQKEVDKRQERERNFFKKLFDFPILNTFARLESLSAQTFDRLKILPHVKMRNELDPFIFKPMEAEDAYEII